MKVLLVLCNAPDGALAAQWARQLVDERLAACVNVLPACRSVYRWQGQVEEAQEVPMLIKTTSTHYAALEARLLELHPYQVPEILALPPSGGLEAYLGWVESELK